MTDKAALRQLIDEEDKENYGPYTCRSCCAPTWNDSDVCDDCDAEAQQ